MLMRKFQSNSQDIHSANKGEFAMPLTVTGLRSGLGPIFTAMVALVLVAQIPGNLRGEPEDISKKRCTLVLDKEPDKVIETWDSTSVVYYVSSESGIGGAKIKRKGDCWPNSIRVRLYLKGLEHGSLKLDGVPVLEFNVPSHAASGDAGDKSKVQTHVTWEKPFAESHSHLTPVPFQVKQVSAPKFSTLKSDGVKLVNEDTANDQTKKEDAEKCWELFIDKSLLKDSSLIEFRWIDFYR